MTTLEKAEEWMTGLSRPDKVKLLQRLLQDVGDAFPGIDHTPGVVGGEARVVRTRIPVWTLVRLRQLGASEAELLQSYPSLRAADLAQAWSYDRAHHSEVEEAIAENEAA